MESRSPLPSFGTCSALTNRDLEIAKFLNQTKCGPATVANPVLMSGYQTVVNRPDVRDWLVPCCVYRKPHLH